jgi:hypothetical protein
MLELEVVGTTEVRGRPARAVLPSSSAPRQIWVPQEWTAVQSEEGLRQRGVMEEDGEGEGEIEMRWSSRTVVHGRTACAGPPSEQRLAPDLDP